MNDIVVKKIVGTDYKSNAYIISSTKTRNSIIIDPNDFVEIRRYCEKHKLKNDYIFLTHEHYDHVAALSLVKKHVGGVIVASESCGKGLDHVEKLLKRTYRLHMHFTQNDKREIPKFEKVNVDNTFMEELTVEWGSIEIILRETIGHSKGSMSIYFKDAMIFSGDAFLEGKAIVTKMLGGNKEEYVNSTLSYYESLPGHITVYPGHGESFLLKDKQ